VDGRVKPGHDEGMQPHFSFLHPAPAHSSFTIRHYGESGPGRSSSPLRVLLRGVE
jgi:hypothetical protein